MAGLGNWLTKIAYCLFPALFIYAAAAYGLTRVPQMLVFEKALVFTVILWLAGHIFQRKMPKVGKWPWILSALILGFGWFITSMSILNNWLIEGDHPILEDWIPVVLLTDWSTRDVTLSLAMMWRTTALLGGMIMAIDYWQDATRGRALVLTMIVTSSGMVLLFFLQRIVGPPFILQSEDGATVLSFATYRYHANGAAYLNMIWPIAGAIAIFAAIRQSMAWPLWLIPLAASVIAIFLNVSKAGNVLAGAGLVLLPSMLLPFARRELRRSKRRVQRSRILAALIPVAIVAASIPFALPWQRWNHYANSFSDPGARIDAYKHFLKMVTDAGMSGFGPGTFSKYYGGYLADSSLLRHQPYWNAHQDYIQTLVEWGYIGAFLWALLLVPPMILLFRTATKKSARSSQEFEGYRIGILDHLKGFFETIPSPREACLAAGAFTAVTLTAIHAAIDFPMQILSLQFYFLTLAALGWSYAQTRITE